MRDGKSSVPDRGMTDRLAGPLQVRCAGTGALPSSDASTVAVGVVSASRLGYAIRPTVAGAADPLLGVTGLLQRPRTSRFRHGAG